MNTEPVAISTVVTVLFTLFGAFFAKYGIVEEDLNTFVGLIGTVISAIIVVITWLKARAKVTPLTNPKNNEGTTLVPLNKAA